MWLIIPFSSLAILKTKLCSRIFISFVSLFSSVFHNNLLPQYFHKFLLLSKSSSNIFSKFFSILTMQGPFIFLFWPILQNTQVSSLLCSFFVTPRKWKLLHPLFYHSLFHKHLLLISLLYTIINSFLSLLFCKNVKSFKAGCISYATTKPHL